VISYRPYWDGTGFGDKLIAGWMVNILIDNGFTAHSGKNIVSHLLDCPTRPPVNHSEHVVFLNPTIQKSSNTNIIDQKVDHLSSVVGKKLVIKDNFIPTLYKDVPEVESVDVSICSRTGIYTPYRNWPYFKDLKKMFDKEGITYTDMDRPGPGMRGWRNHWVLNCVHKSKLYLGLETGTSHYVSKYAAGKALILQSGYSDFNYWAKYYDYDVLNFDVECSPCFINQFQKPCTHSHKCMYSLKPKIVFDYVIEKLLNIPN